MGCLTDYIGIRWCGGTSSPPSSLYVNDLPGISLKQINSITDEENATFLSLWNNIQDRAERRFSLDVREAMSAKYQLKSLAQGVNLGNLLVDGSTVAMPSVSNINLELNTVSNPDFTPSPLLQINIQNINYYCAEANDVGANININIINSESSEILYSFSTTIRNEYWNAYEINKSFIATNSSPQPLKLKLQISSSGSLLTSLVQLPNDIQNTQCCGVRARGSSSLPEDFSYTYGLSATFNVTCSWDGLICQNKNLFSRAFWYLCGIEFLTELIYSSVLTSWTTINLQKAKDLRAEYEVEYQKSLSQVASGMNLDCDCCLDCSGGVQIRTATQFF